MTCPHEMPIPASCVDCMQDGPVRPPRVWQRVGGPFPAAYPADCAACRMPIGAGNLIQRWDYGDTADDDGRTVYVHAECKP